MCWGKGPFCCSLSPSQELVEVTLEKQVKGGAEDQDLSDLIGEND